MFSYESPSTVSDTALSPSLLQLAAHLHTANPSLFLAAVLPEQFPGAGSTVRPRSGVVDLLCAVLEDALHCVRIPEERCTARTQRLAQEAETWLFSDDESWPFAFVNICEALGLDPAAVRRTLRRTDRRPAEAGQRTKRRVSHKQRPLYVAA
ncbi:MAG TPA: hypothetical protein VNN62_21610 [Methylomirabilota bacterium]|nr:hypothetical protein [Methylomirabilota bacterium]